jgi:uncharacterized protein (DUF1810 family)
MSIQRFIDAHNENYDIALHEILSGRKRSHWIWYIFPQIEGLGLSSISKYYSIKDYNEALEYINNELLFNHLIEISTALLNLKTNNIDDIMDEPDDIKLRSCMTLFSIVLPECDIFTKVLDKYYHGIKDKETIKILHLSC